MLQKVLTGEPKNAAFALQSKAQAFQVALIHAARSLEYWWATLLFQSNVAANKISEGSVHSRHLSAWETRYFRGPLWVNVEACELKPVDSVSSIRPLQCRIRRLPLRRVDHPLPPNLTPACRCDVTLLLTLFNLFNLNGPLVLWSQVPTV